ncbi:FecR family protein [Acinetobacter lactucae]|uniref:FecR family protein n=1 Tax=Acinetobacter lactucae TaxID=1785128 RepID=UPI00077E285D|nr:FecR domain-containing protein [Acinetobacter lactucae]
MGFNSHKDRKNENFLDKSIGTSQQIDDEALEWIMILTSGESNTKVILDCQKWRKQSSQHEQAFQNARSLWLSLSQSDQLSPNLYPEFQLIENNRFKSISPFSIPQLLIWQRFFPDPRFMWPILFLFFSISVLSIYLLQPNYDYETNYGQIKNFQLSDGSQVTLNTNSGIKVNFSSSQREILLEKGEAFIHVSHANIPLIVKTGDNIIKAMNSAFSIAKDNKNVKIIVSEGSLNITHPISKRTPVYKGQQVIFNHYQMNIKSINVSQQLSWKKGILTFSNDSLYNIINTAQKYDHRTWVIYLNSQNKNKLFSTTINIKDMDHWLDALTKITPIKVKRFGSILIIYD